MRAKREFTITSEKVQGLGTWVKFKRLTWEEIKPFFGKDALEKIAAQILDWNWTDENGQKLPLPKNGEALASLLVEEMNFLFDAVNTWELGEDEAKN